MRRAMDVKPLDGYHISVLFDNGETRVFDCTSLLEDKLFEDLRDERFFKEKVHIDDMGIVCWDEATDINPYILYEQSVPSN